VYLVGAGPGDPQLITLRGIQCLQRADVVLHDYLVNPQLLNHAPPHADRISLGSHSGQKRWTQDEINRQLVTLAQAGKSVVRLKGGDPAIFAHLDEELETLEAHKIPYEIVPGITTALAAGSHAGIPLTQRDDASAVALITGRERPGKPTSIDWGRFAQFPGTLVIYMGVTTVETWSQGLLDGGMSPQSPVALVRRCSWPDQQILHTTLAEVQSQLTPRSNFPPPVLAVIGPVAARARQRNWFADRPLVGRRILVTRPAHQAHTLDQQLTELGAEVLHQPAIAIGPPPDWTPVDVAISNLDSFDWIVFSSANGVTYFLDRIWHLGLDLRRLNSCQLASIGPGTTAELQRYHLRANCEPTTHRAEALAQALAPHVSGKRCLLIRASRGREVLAEQLQAAGADIHQVVTYTSQDVTQPDPAITRLLKAGQIDWTTVTSSAIARSLVQMFGDALHHTRLVSISPITSATLRQLGFEPFAEAETYTIEGVSLVLSP
jgi:uroporphyrinogen III methyltransferase/synthase